MSRKTASILLLPLLGVGIAACGESVNEKESKIIHNIAGQLQYSQPAPIFKTSQIRQTLIDIETAQAKRSATTSFFFNLGVSEPIQSCPSIGFPVASTTQLTNPLQETGGTAIGAIDPNGVYSGNSTGTYVVCVAPDGSNYAQYWEGFVDAVSGPAIWDSATHSIKLTGTSTIQLKATP